MGYNGMGYQRWIATMKPRKFLAKRSKPDGGGMEHISNQEIEDFYHLKKNKLENLLKKKYSLEYKASQKKQFKIEHQRNLIISVISVIISVLLFLLLLHYFVG